MWLMKKQNSLQMKMVSIYRVDASEASNPQTENIQMLCALK